VLCVVLWSGEASGSEALGLASGLHRRGPGEVAVEPGEFACGLGAPGDVLCALGVGDLAAELGHEACGDLFELGGCAGDDGAGVAAGLRDPLGDRGLWRDV
jgi:hypothetical protein